MNNLRQAAEMALKALNNYVRDEKFDGWAACDAIRILRQALAEPDQISELRTRLNQMRDLQEYGEVGIASEEHIAGYNAAVEEVLEHLRDMGLDTGTDRGAWSDVENATKWVDELRGDEPEPLAWIGQRKDGAVELTDTEPTESVRREFNMRPLYAEPPNRIWQSIRVDEIGTINDYVPVEPKQTRVIRLARAIEAKLKQKNT